MRDEISRDSGQPLRAEGIEAGLLDGVEQIGRVAVVWAEPQVNGGVVEAELQDGAVREGAQAGVSSRVCLSKQCVSVFDVR
jgi:hypothetical protein